MSSSKPVICENLSKFRYGTFIEFASTPIHVATSLEIVANNPKIEWEYKYWGNSTFWKIGMNVEFNQYKNRFPERLSDFLKRMNVPENKCTTEMLFNGDHVRSKMSNLEELIRSTRRISDLRRWDGDFGDVGAAVANAYASLFNDKYTPITWNVGIIRKLTLSYLQVYESTLNLCELNEKRGVSKSEHVFITYNGRFLHERAVRDACNAFGFPIYFHETTRDKYFLRSEGFHDRTANQELWLSHWQNSSEPFERKHEIARDYYKGLEVAHNPFHTKNKDLLDSIVRKPYVVYFTSNDDETLGFWDVWKEELGNQLEVLKQLYSFFSTRKEVELIIRIHPNTKNKPWQVRRIWKNIKPSENVRVINEKSEISSLELAKKSLGVMTFGSTIGLQASFLKKPVCVLADCAYDRLNCVTKINSLADLQEWYESLGGKDSFDNEGWVDSLVRPYFVATAGVKFNLFTISLHGWNSWSLDPEGIELLFPAGLKLKKSRVERRLRILLLRIRHVFNVDLDRGERF
jgi:hypothetical protein